MKLLFFFILVHISAVWLAVVCVVLLFRFTQNAAKPRRASERDRKNEKKKLV